MATIVYEKNVKKLKSTLLWTKNSHPMILSYIWRVYIINRPGVAGAVL